MAKVVKTLSLDPEIAAYLEQMSNASSYVNELIRRQMVHELIEKNRGRPITAEELARAREWARKAMQKINAAPTDPAYQRARRRALGIDD